MQGAVGDTILTNLGDWHAYFWNGALKFPGNISKTLFIWRFEKCIVCALLKLRWLLHGESLFVKISKDVQQIISLNHRDICEGYSDGAALFRSFFI